MTLHWSNWLFKLIIIAGYNKQQSTQEEAEPAKTANHFKVLRCLYSLNSCWFFLSVGELIKTSCLQLVIRTKQVQQHSSQPQKVFNQQTKYETNF